MLLPQIKCKRNGDLQSRELRMFILNLMFRNTLCRWCQLTIHSADVCLCSNSWSYLREHSRQCVNTSVENGPHYLSAELPRIRHLWESPIESLCVPPLPLSFYFPARMKDVRHDVNFTRQRYDSLDIYSGNLTELWCIVSYTVCLRIKISCSTKIYNSQGSRENLKRDICC